LKYDRSSALSIAKSACRARQASALDAANFAEPPYQLLKKFTFHSVGVSYSHMTEAILNAKASPFATLLPLAVVMPG
jgi:hypothetical protein